VVQERSSRSPAGLIPGASSTRSMLLMPRRLQPRPSSASSPSTLSKPRSEVVHQRFAERSGKPEQNPYSTVFFSGLKGPRQALPEVRHGGGDPLRPLALDRAHHTLRRGRPTRYRQQHRRACTARRCARPQELSLLRLRRRRRTCRTHLLAARLSKAQRPRPRDLSPPPPRTHRRSPCQSHPRTSPVGRIDHSKISVHITLCGHSTRRHTHRNGADRTLTVQRLCDTSGSYPKPPSPWA